jgi:hypothetical protein
VDDCSWAINFTNQREFRQKANALLDEVHTIFSESGFRLDADKTEVAWIFAGGRPGSTSRRKAEDWELNWRPPVPGANRITRKFDIKAKPVRWLGFFIDCRFNWQAHIKHRLALGHGRIKAIARVMNANGVPRKLARKVAWAVSMSTAAYGVEALWEGQQWLLDGFNKLTTVIARAVAGTFSSTKGEDAIRAADIPPARPALDRRRERLLAAIVAAPKGTPK